MASNEEELDIKPTYIVDQVGERTAVILTIGEFKQLVDVANRELRRTTGELVGPSIEQDRPTDIPNLEATAEEEVFSYHMPRKGADARAVWRYPSMVVLKGSRVAKQETDTMSEPYRRLRKWLMKKGVIAEVDGSLSFTRDYRFHNSSEAVCVVEGGSRSGYASWIDRQGKTLSDLGYRRNAAD